jgi:hypothetical protein
MPRVVTLSLFAMTRVGCAEAANHEHGLGFLGRAVLGL